LSPKKAGSEGVQWALLILDWTSRTCKVVNLINFSWFLKRVLNVMTEINGQQELQNMGSQYLLDQSKPFIIVKVL
jgi:hypothetical protein